MDHLNVLTVRLYCEINIKIRSVRLLIEEKLAVCNSLRFRMLSQISTWLSQEKSFDV
jgi:hypothetical protein